MNVVAASDASKVVCTGEGLKVGIMGKEIKSVIDTRRAGPGMLNSSCQKKCIFVICQKILIELPYWFETSFFAKNF